MDVLEELEVLDPHITNYVATRIEMPPPHKVAVLILIQNYLKAKKAAADADVVYPTRSRRNFCILLLKLIQFPDMTYNELHNLLTAPRFRINSLHLEGFEKSMADLFSLGVEGLFDFAEVKNIEKMLAEQLGVSQFSLVGLYIRRVGVVLERLSFPEMLSLYKNICTYYEKGVRAMAIGPRKGLSGSLFHCSESLLTDSRQSDEDTRTATDKESSLEEPVINTRTVYQERQHHSKWSPRQADLFVVQQTQLLETNEIRALTPIDMQKKLSEIIKDNQLNSQAYFLWAMNQLRVRDFIGSMDAFHRAFDRCPAMFMVQTENKQGFQYFSVNLAIFQASFDHYEEAMLALKECVMLSQEEGDKRCLDLANSWFCLLNGHKIDPIEKSLPDSQYPGLMQSLSMAILYVVKYGGYCGCRPLDLFELLSKSDDINRRNSIIEHVADSLAIRSGLWCLYGHYEISALFSQFLINLKKNWAFGDYGNLESMCPVLSNMAQFLSEQGEYQMSAVVMNHAHDRIRRFPNRAMISACEYQINATQAIHHCNWTIAHNSCCELFLLNEFDGNLQRATVYVASGQHYFGRYILHNQQITDEVNVVQLVRLMILMAFSAMGRHRTTAETLSLLIRAHCICNAAYMEYQRAYVKMMMAQALLSMNMVDKANQAINNCLDMIYANGSLYERALADLVYAKCYMAVCPDEQVILPSSVGEASTDPQQEQSEEIVTIGRRKKELLRIATILEATVERLKPIDAHAKILDIYAFLSKSFHKINEREYRNKYAGKFRSYFIDFPVATNALGLPF